MIDQLTYVFSLIRNLCEHNFGLIISYVSIAKV